MLPPSAKGFSVNSEKGQLGYTLIFPQKSMFLQNVTFLPIHFLAIQYITLECLFHFLLLVVGLWCLWFIKNL